MKIPLIAVVGPTASGKSRLAVELALNWNGEVVSADSMQVYRGMDIGTAKPVPEEMRGVRHHMIGFADPSRPFSVADYVRLAGQCIAEIDKRGKLPILAGGTGLYVRSLLKNTRFAETERDEALRARLFERAEREGPESLVTELESFDPQSARRIDPHNIPRLVRAIELYRTTGVTMTDHLRRSRLVPSPYDACVIGLAFRDRRKLYARIDARVGRMLEAGLVEEARAVLARPDAQTALQAIGYKELAPYFRGEITLAQAAETIKRETRRYAKRQMTWFRRDEDVRWIHVDDYPEFGGVVSAANQIVGRIRHEQPCS